VQPQVGGLQKGTVTAFTNHMAGPVITLLNGEGLVRGFQIVGHRRDADGNIVGLRLQETSTQFGGKPVGDVVELNKF
jgi:hypothetical protein